MQQDDRDRQQRRRRHRAPVLDVGHREPVRPGRQAERDAEHDPEGGPDPEAEQDPLQARDDVCAELREEPEILELREDRRRRREVPASADAAHACQATTIATGTAISATTRAPVGAPAHSPFRPLGGMPPQEATLERREGEVGGEAEHPGRQGERVELGRETVRLRVVELTSPARAFP